jgi:hypothetical protein
LVLGDYGEVGSFRKGREENPLKKKKERTDRRKSLCLFSLGGKKERSRKCRQVFEGEGREEEVKEVRAPPWMESFGRRVWPIPSDIITISSLHTPPRT